MANNTLRIATRKSPLAMWQAEYIRDRLISIHPELNVELLGMTTQGDKILDSPLSKIGGKGLFVKELEQRMLEGDADIAVHSMKDVPVDFPAGLHLAVICEREDPTDAFVSNNFKQLEDLPQGAKVGTSSLRRQCQLRTLRPDLQLLDLRGNVNTRLRKLDEDQYDAIILASAGLKRLGFEQRIAQRLDTQTSLPAVGQGAVGIECRINDERINNLIAPLNDTASATRVWAERAMNDRLEGGCQVPIAGHATLDGDELYIRGLVGRPDGTQLIRAERRGPIADAQKLGTELADELLKQGAREILQELYKNSQ